MPVPGVSTLLARPLGVLAASAGGAATSGGALVASLPAPPPTWTSLTAPHPPEPLQHATVASSNARVSVRTESCDESYREDYSALLYAAPAAAASEQSESSRSEPGVGPREQ